MVMMIGRVPVPSPGPSSSPSRRHDMSTATPGTIQPTKTPTSHDKPNHGLDQYGMLWVLGVIVLIVAGVVALYHATPERR